MAYVRANNLSEAAYYKAFLKVEPYCNNVEIKNLILQEIDNL